MMWPAAAAAMKMAERKVQRETRRISSSVTVFFLPALERWPSSQRPSLPSRGLPLQVVYRDS